MHSSTLPESAYEGLGLSPATVKLFTTPPAAPATAASPNVLEAEPESARELAMDESSIALYAELLLNIRTVTLFASLRTVHNRQTKAKLSTDGYSITISHEGASATISLPIKAKGDGDATLELPASPPSKELSLRLQIEEQDGSELFTDLQAEERKANVIPWGGASLNETKGLIFECRKCRNVIIDGSKITDWRDLPNENWAEMMDFWHCHKPDEHHLHDHTHNDAVSQKGYAAGNQLRATEGVGFVDLSSFLFKDSDCEGVKSKGVKKAILALSTMAASSIQPPKKKGLATHFARLGEPSLGGWGYSAESNAANANKPLICKTCHKRLGHVDDKLSGYRISKWCLDINITQSPAPHTSPSTEPSPVSSSSDSHPSSASSSSYTPQKWISARLLSLIENLGIRKFHIHPSFPSPPSSSSTSTSPGLLIWVFTPDLLFSSSITSPGRRDPTRALKVFYQYKAWRELQPGQPEEVSVEDVALDADLYDDLERGLVEGGRLLPVGARKFREWEVGLLERFGVEEVKIGCSGGGREDKLDNAAETRDDEKGEEE